MICFSRGKKQPGVEVTAQFEERNDFCNVCCHFNVTTGFMTVGFQGAFSEDLPSITSPYRLITALSEKRCQKFVRKP